MILLAAVLSIDAHAALPNIFSIRGKKFPPIFTYGFVSWSYGLDGSISSIFSLSAIRRLSFLPTISFSLNLFMPVLFTGSAPSSRFTGIGSAASTLSTVSTFSGCTSFIRSSASFSSVSLRCLSVMSVSS